VVELHVPEGADMIGRSIEDTGLWDDDISILTLTRGTRVIPNPKGERVLEHDDRLLCFGKLERMRHLVPERRRRARSRIGPLPDQGENDSDRA